MCECHYCDNYVIGREICHIYGRPVKNLFCFTSCPDFVGRKRGKSFYRQGRLEYSSYEIKDSIEKIRLKFWIEDNIYAFCELKTKDTDNIIPIVGKKYLIEFQPRAGRDGNTINSINKVFIPLGWNMIYDCDVLVRQKIWHIGVSVEAENKEETLKKAQDLDWGDCMETEVGEIEEVLEVDFYD